MTLSDYSDDDIAREYHRRMLRKLGDPRVAVTAPPKAPEPENIVPVEDKRLALIRRMLPGAKA